MDKLAHRESVQWRAAVIYGRRTGR